jgi:hypothetical protein
MACCGTALLLPFFTYTTSAFALTTHSVLNLKNFTLSLLGARFTVTGGEIKQFSVSVLFQCIPRGKVEIKREESSIKHF